MTTLPKLVAADWETADENGMGSIEWWRPGFHTVSAAFSWRVGDVIKSHWCRDPWLIIKELSAKKIPLVAHNLAFESAVASELYPNDPLNWAIDTLRLAALYDSGLVDQDNVLEEEGAVKQDGLALAACSRRILGQADSKQQADLKIRELFPNAKVEEYGKLKVKLPEADLKLYNVGDTELTLQLCEKILAEFETEGYDWKPDHTIYLHECKLINQALKRGIVVDRDALTRYRDKTLGEVGTIESQFRTEMGTVIAKVEDTMWEELKAKYKTERGANGCERPTFNIGSTTQLTKLFVEEQGIKPKFWTTPTKKSSKDFVPKPSFRASHIGQFGKGGEILQKRGGRLIVANQASKLLALSEPDGCWHMSIKAQGTNTGRGAGEGGVNGQGLSRRDYGLMSTLLPPPGKTFFSMDLSAGEPTLTTHFSGDKLYRSATFDLVGKKPYFDNGILMIGDLYLMVGSVSPFAKELLDAWKYGVYEGRSFADQWETDPSPILKSLKKFRNFVKMICLALSYGLGPKTMITHAQKNGYVVTLVEAKAFYGAYWSLFKGVKEFGKRLEQEFKRKGYLYNCFGYRLAPTEGYKCLNYFIQSGVSGLMNLINMNMFTDTSPCDFVGLIHDEDIGQFADGTEAEVLDFKNQVMDDVNTALAWDVKVRTGWAVGKNLYEAK